MSGLHQKSQGPIQIIENGNTYFVANGEELGYKKDEKSGSLKLVEWNYNYVMATKHGWRLNSAII